MKKLTLITIFWQIVFFANAQTTVRGQVLDEKGEALPGANVFLEGTYDGASSTSDGKFEFKTSENGSKILRIEFIGFQPVSTHVDLDQKEVVIEVSLKEAFNQLEAVTITAGSFEAGDRKRSIELTSNDVATTAGAMGDIIGAINTLPGTSRVAESGRLYVRGGSHEETKTFIDDLLVGSPYYAGAPNLATRGRFNPFLFNGTVFNTGGYSAEYGQALSSVLLLNTTHAKIKDELNVSLIGGLGGDLTGTKSWNDGSVTVSGTYFNIKPYVAIVRQNQDWIKPMEIMSNEISFKQKAGKSGVVKWYSNLNSSAFNILQADLDNAGQRINYGQRNQNYFLNTSYKNTLTDKWIVITGFSMSRNLDRAQIESGTMRDQTDVVHAKFSVDHQATELINIKAGIDYFFNGFTTSFKPDISVRNSLWAAFTEASIYTSTKLVFRVGTRAEYSTYLQSKNLSPRFSAAYKIDDVSQFSLAAGTFYQLPFNQDLINEKMLKVERADHVLLNYQRNILSRLFRAEIFYKNYDQLVQYDQPSFTHKTNYRNDGHGYAYGLDVFFRDAKSIRNGHYWMSYSFLKTERRYRDFPVMSTPTFASAHNVSLVYKHFSQAMRSMISGDVSYASPRRYHDPNNESFNAGKIDGYYALNLSWAYLFRSQIIFYSAVTNVLGTENVYGYRFASTRGPDGLYASEPIVPAAPRFFLLGVFFTFSKDKTRNQLDKLN
jgi:hypothetical protein